MLYTRGVQRFVDAARDLRPRQADIFEPEGNLAVDNVVDRLQLGILKDEADMARHVAGGHRDSVASYYLSVAGDPSAVEVRNKTVEDSEQRRLAASGWTSDYRQAVLDSHACVLQGGFVATGIPVRDVGHRRDRHTSTGARRSKQAAIGRGSIPGRVIVG